MEPAKRKVIITGASGFVGSHLLKLLEAKSYEVFALVHRTDIDLPEERKIRGSIKRLTAAKIDKIKPDMIFHCARPTFPILKRTGRKIAALLAARYNRQLLVELRSSSSKPLLVFSSGSLLYGSSDNPFSESSPIHPISYARQYHRGELPLIRAAENNDYPVLLFRLPWLLGPGSWFKWFYLQPALNRHAIPLFGGGSNMMDIIDMRDAASLMHFYAEKKIKGVCNIIPERAITQADFASKVSKIFSVEIHDHSKIFSGRLENESLEAFQSNIVLSSRYADELNDFTYRPLEDSLSDIMTGKWDFH